MPSASSVVFNIYENDILNRFPGYTLTRTTAGNTITWTLRDGGSNFIQKYSGLTDSEVLRKLRGNLGFPEAVLLLSTTAQKLALSPVSKGQVVFDLDLNQSQVYDGVGWVISPKDTDDLPEGATNLYYTEPRVSANTDVAANTTHRGQTNNPHTVTKSQVGLGNVDNTSDLDKPVSTAQQTALDGKKDDFTENSAFNKNFGSSASTVCEGDDARLSDARPPTSHTHLEADITDLDKYTKAEVDALVPDDTDGLPEGSSNLYYSDTLVSNNSDVAANTAKRSYPVADENKLLGIEPLAEVNTINAGDNVSSLVNDVPYLSTVSGGDHTTLSNIGINSHAQLDSHVADNTIHFTEASLNLSDKEDKVNKGIANGYAPLDGTNKIPDSYLPTSTVQFKGTFGSVGSTTGGDLPSSGNTEGDLYICDTNGYSSAEAGLTFDNGDHALYDGSGWHKIDNNESVSSVFGRMGAVIAQNNDYTWNQIDKAASDIADIATKSHTSLTDIGSNTHAQIDTKISDLEAGKEDAFSKNTGFNKDFGTASGTVAEGNDSRFHAAVTVTDTPEIDLALSGQDISAAIVASSIAEGKLNASVNASLDLADSALQNGDNVSELVNDAGYLTSETPAPVDSVNGKTGVVVLDATDVGALQSGDNVSELVNNDKYVESIQEGFLINVDDTDPKNPIVAFGLGSVVESLTGDGVGGTAQNPVMSYPSAGDIGAAENAHTHSTTDIISGTFADARISETNVTQHESALTVTASQVSDFDTEVSNNTSVSANTAKVSANGSVTTHNDVTNAGSGIIISGIERTNLSNQSGTNTGDEVDASETVKGIVERATDAEAAAGTDTTRYITPKQLADNDGGLGYVLATWGADLQTIGRHPAINGTADGPEIPSLGVSASAPVPAAGTIDTITYYNSTGDNTTEFQIIKNGVVMHTFTCIGPYGVETGINVSTGFVGSVPDNIAIRYSAGMKPASGFYSMYIK